MRASLLFYRKLRKEFKAYSLEVKPYDPCMANMMAKAGKQLMVIWHIDDLKALCKNGFKLIKDSCYLAKINRPNLSMHTGKRHNYLRVDMEFNDDGSLDMSMIKYLKDVIANFPEEITGKAAFPAADHLFNVRDERETKALEEERAWLFITW
jgi:hypothetical protein